MALYDLEAQPGELTSGQGIQSLYPQNVIARDTYGPSVDATGLAPLQQEPDISGNVKRPGFLELLPSALAGPGGVEFTYQRLMAQRAAPVMSRLMQEGSKALLTGDYDKADKIVTGMSNLAGQFPQFAPQIKAFTDRINEKRTKIEQNKALLEASAEILSKDPAAQRALGALSQHVSTLDPSHTQKVIEKMFPNVTAHDNWIQAVSPLSGEEINRVITPTMIKPEILMTQQREALALKAPDIPEAKFVDLMNRYNDPKSRGKMTLDEFALLQKGFTAMQQGAAEAIGISRLPVPAAIEHNIEPGGRAELTGTQQPGALYQPQMQGSSNASTVQTALKNTEASSPNSVSHKGAVGLYQLMPETAARYLPQGLSNDQITTLLKDPKTNEKIANQYIQYLMKKYNGNINAVAAAYFSGEGNVRPDGSIINPNLHDGTKETPGTTVADYIKRFNDMLGTASKGVSSKQAELEYPAFVPPPGATATQKANAFKAWQKGKEQYLQSKATQTAMREEQPLGEQYHLFKVNPETKDIEEYQGERPSANQAMKEGWYRTAEPAEAKQIRNYNAVKNQGIALFNTLKDIPQNVLGDDLSDNVKRAIELSIANGISIPIKVPIVGGAVISVPGIGVVSLRPQEAALYTQLTGFAQASEDFLNTSGKANKYVESVKAALTGVFTSKDLALAVIKEILDQGEKQVIGRMRTQKGSVPSEYKGLELELPELAAVEKAKGQSSLEERVKQRFREESQRTREFEKVQPSPAMPQGALPSTQQTPDLRGLVPEFKIGEPELTHEQLITPNWAPRKPINPDTVKNLKGLRQ